MGVFSEYIKSILTVGVCAFLCESLSSVFQKSKASESAVRLMVNLCVFTVAVSPLFSAFSYLDFNSFKINETQYNEESTYTLNALTAKELEKQVSSKIYESTRVFIKDIKIDIKLENDAILIKKVTAEISSKDDIEKVNLCIKEMLGQEINTEITVKNDEQN